MGHFSALQAIVVLLLFACFIVFSVAQGLCGFAAAHHAADQPNRQGVAHVHFRKALGKDPNDRVILSNLKPAMSAASDTVQKPHNSQASTLPAPKRGAAYRNDGWVVLKGERQVLWMNDEPGILVSTAILPPGVRPTRHPFLTAQSHDPFEENKLREILDRCHTFAEFVKALKKAGYTIVPRDNASR